MTKKRSRNVSKYGRNGINGKKSGKKHFESDKTE